MKNYTKTYMDFFEYGIDDYIPCEVCGAKSVDIHHIDPKRMGGSKKKDNIENLIALCRNDHNKAHSNKLSQEYLKEIHKANIGKVKLLKLKL